jgi:hypothetical protein
MIIRYVYTQSMFPPDHIPKVGDEVYFKVTRVARVVRHSETSDAEVVVYLAEHAP